jgi:hypothetical protein
MQDKLGQEITEGCWIVYGHAEGRHAALRIGKILKISIDNTGRYAPDRITVRGIDDDYTSRKKLSLSSRVGTLMFPDRMIVVPDDKVPESYRKLMQDAGL